ncbi:hypothetical protein MSAN_01109800 [Mycena sanguinolenta]|uniref:Uncharacterized protein n=1 Tax=Mycena sanguinolenta TaxID=230812 RepID=A0A8H6YGM8_9AGAR|nr:hypothetical protein MSAN_01109800 [Mycena sanguinolenta]
MSSPSIGFYKCAGLFPPGSTSHSPSASLLQAPFILVPSPVLLPDLVATSPHVPAALAHCLVHGVSSFRAPPASSFSCMDPRILCDFPEEMLSLTVPHSHFYALDFTYHGRLRSRNLSYSR